jgi:hypothetical protein
MAADESMSYCGRNVAEDPRHSTRTAERLSNLKKQDTEVNSEIDPNHGSSRTKVVVMKPSNLPG